MDKLTSEPELIVVSNRNNYLNEKVFIKRVLEWLLVLSKTE